MKVTWVEQLHWYNGKKKNEKKKSPRDEKIIMMILKTNKRRWKYVAICMHVAHSVAGSQSRLRSAFTIPLRSAEEPVRITSTGHIITPMAITWLDEIIRAVNWKQRGRVIRSLWKSSDVFFFFFSWSIYYNFYNRLCTSHTIYNSANITWAIGVNASFPRWRAVKVAGARHRLN